MKVLLVSYLPVICADAERTLGPYDIHSEGPACPIDDPLGRERPLPLNITRHDILSIEHGSEISNILADGLSTFNYEVDLSLILLSFTFNVTLEKLSSFVSYNASGYVDARPFSQGTIPSGNFTGSGIGFINATNVKLEGSGSFWNNLLIPDLIFNRLNLNTVSFDSFTVDLGADFIIAGSSVDWSVISAGFRINFDREFAENKQEITDRHRKALNTAVRKYTQTDFINYIYAIVDGSETECEIQSQ